MHFDHLDDGAREDGFDITSVAAQEDLQLLLCGPANMHLWDRLNVTNSQNCHSIQTHKVRNTTEQEEDEVGVGVVDSKTILLGVEPALSKKNTGNTMPG